MINPIEQFKTILPDTAAVNERGHLTIGGCDAVDLVEEFGSPLYVFDEVTLRAKCHEYLTEFRARYPETTVIYACKAYINRILARIFDEEGLGLDVVSGGELYIGKSVGFPMERVYFHGNNKSEAELRLALASGIGRIVVDNFHELSMLDRNAQRMGIKQKILLRLSPGIDPHTHAKTATGIVDSKFGFLIQTGHAEKAVAQALAAPGLELMGLHIHLGSPLFETEPYREGIEAVFRFAAQMKAKHGFEMKEFSPGGGFAIPYLRTKPAPAVAEYAEAIASTIKKLASELNLPLPKMTIEPGRSIVGRAGVALYRTGARKEIPGVRTYVSVDGGMSDNIRPALYEAKYEALVASKVGEKA
ncbi:MAG: diaminopimelate decarboxylase, partial [Chloroflexi bacterium]|nr:diaminopimelate decarboxylase [Chloroflexota bacterium]